MNLSFKLNNINLIKYCKIKDQQFFFLTDKDFFKLPSYYGFKLENKVLTLYCNNILFKRNFFKFALSLFRAIKKKGKPFVKKLLLKGLGLKAALSADLHILELKLGFSHLVKIKIPLHKVNVKCIKNGLLVFGTNLSYICNFMYKIKSLKLPNIYKGKGIWYKKEIVYLKEIKKS